MTASIATEALDFNTILFGLLAGYQPRFHPNTGRPTMNKSGNV